MTYTEQFNKQLQSISDYELFIKAQDILGRLCSTGGQSFRMTIPPQTYDTDIVLAELIRRFKDKL